MLKKIAIAVCYLIMTSNITTANEKLTIVLDWYLNPDHAALIAAKQIGSFAKQGLDVDIISPSDPHLGPRLVAAQKADLAISYQQHLYMSVKEELPLIRVGTLIATPLNSIIALPNKGIKTPADLKGKKIGHSVSGIDSVSLNTILKHQGLSIDDVDMINVNFNLVSALMTGQVDAVIGACRNVEGNEIREQGFEPVIMKVEDYGIPPYEELVIIAHKDLTNKHKIQKFLAGLKQGAHYVKQNPEQSWDKFAAEYSDLATDLNKKIWLDTVSLFSDNPATLDREKYSAYGQFLLDHKFIEQNYPVESYATQL